MYGIESRGVTAGPFEIGGGIYQQAWKPTLEYFLPVQIVSRGGTRRLTDLARRLTPR